MATQMTMRAMGPSRDDGRTKMYGGLPSPTLTNPDMVLPDEPLHYPHFTSPTRNVWRERPPSPSYLRDTPPESLRARSSSGGSNMATPKKEKRGLMSRKMMLLRSRTSSSGLGINGVSKSISSEGESDIHDMTYGLSPKLMDVGNLAPEQPEQRRTSASGSSLGSDELYGLPQFLAKYEANNASSGEEEWEGESPASQRYGNSANIESGLDAQRRQQEEDEQNSAILSKRAEQILANAKKRLNLMEGNLRGARDLVQPLTAANLKRATSVGSYASPAGMHSMRGRYVHDGYQYEPSLQQKQRKLHAQASSPTMGQDYTGHYRGFSETGIPERPHTSLERTNTPMGATPRIPAKASEPSWNNGLRGTRSHDAIGPHAMRQPASRDSSYTRGSPDPNLGPLVEDDVSERRFAPPTSRFADRSDAYSYGSSRPSSRTEDLREQMSSLKGKISSLRERAREDSIRRQSMQNLREPSPLNNAQESAPEFFYTQSQTYGSPVLDTNAGVGWSSENYSPQKEQGAFEPQQLLTGSRNAFAEQVQDQRRGSKNNNSQDSVHKYRGMREQPSHQSLHKRTPSGTTIVQSSKHRYSHHEAYHNRNVSNGSSQYEEVFTAEVGVARGGEPQDDDAMSQSEATVYEDAEEDQPAPVVAHEDREDAFDYQQFWLTTALGGDYGKEKRDSVSSEESGSSVETARGPTAAGAGVEEEEMSPPASPETPEKLREIERNIHKRTFSDESVSTVASFATAAEGRDSPAASSKRSSPTASRTLSRSEPNSRPSTAIPIKRISPSGIASDNSSDRADSGVGLPNRPASSQSAKRSPLKAAMTSSALSPPMSPQAFTDPATVAVNAVLEPNGRQLGLKDKALLFSLVESLRTVCHQMQEHSESDFESRALRRRLDDARKILNGAMS